MLRAHGGGGLDVKGRELGTEENHSYECAFDFISEERSATHRGLLVEGSPRCGSVQIGLINGALFLWVDGPCSGRH